MDSTEQKYVSKGPFFRSLFPFLVFIVFASLYLEGIECSIHKTGAKDHFNRHAYWKDDDLKMHVEDNLRNEQEKKDWLPLLVNFCTEHTGDTCYPYEVMAHLFYTKYQIRGFQNPWLEVPKEEHFDWLRAVVVNDRYAEPDGDDYRIHSNLFASFFKDWRHRQIWIAWDDFRHHYYKLYGKAEEIFVSRLGGDPSHGVSEEGKKAGRAFVETAKNWRKNKYSEEKLKKYEVQQQLGKDLGHLWDSIPKEKLAQRPAETPA